ncbi:MAG: hypothetical protein PVJ92_02285 [Candidatus Dependentiae bacterium]|jgi:hypothetical protein
MRKRALCLLLSVFVTGLCQARVVLLLAAVTGTGASDYFLADHTSADALKSDSVILHKIVPTNDNVFIMEGMGFDEALEKLRSMATVCEDQISGTDAIKARAFVNLFHPKGWRPAAINEAWSRGGRLLLRESYKQTEKMWGTSLAGGAYIIAAGNGDIGTQLAAESVLFEKPNPLKGAFRQAKSTDLAAAESYSMALVGLRRGCHESKLHLIKPSLIRQICGTQCYVRRHTSGLFYLVHTWLDNKTLTRRMTENRGKLFPSLSDEIALCLHEDDVPVLQGYWGTTGAYCAWLQESAKTTSFREGEAIFARWRADAQATAEILAKHSKDSGFGGGRTVSPPSPTDKEGADSKAGGYVPPLLLPGPVDDWGTASPTGSPKNHEVKADGAKPRRKRWGWGLWRHKNKDSEGLAAPLLSDGVKEEK